MNPNPLIQAASVISWNSWMARTEIILTLMKPTADKCLSANEARDGCNHRGRNKKGRSSFSFLPAEMGFLSLSLLCAR